MTAGQCGIWGAIRAGESVCYATEKWNSVQLESGAGWPQKDLDLALERIAKDFGEGAIMRLGDNRVAPIEVIPTGNILIDRALGVGGFPRGRIIEIFGPESSGKARLTLTVAAQAQKRGGLAAFVDVEHALDPQYARRLGVDLDALLISQPSSGEEALRICETLIRSNALDVIVLDSVAALVTKAELEGEMQAPSLALNQAARKELRLLDEIKLMRTVWMMIWGKNVHLVSKIEEHQRAH
jgi:recombination protein RecA